MSQRQSSRESSLFWIEVDIELLKTRFRWGISGIDLLKRLGASEERWCTSTVLQTISSACLELKACNSCNPCNPCNHNTVPVALAPVIATLAVRQCASCPVNSFISVDHSQKRPQTQHESQRKRKHTWQNRKRQSNLCTYLGHLQYVPNSG